MNDARREMIEKLLLGFVPFGLLLVVGSWLVTGVKPLTVAPFVLLIAIWTVLRPSHPSKRSRDAG